MLKMGQDAAYLQWYKTIRTRFHCELCSFLNEEGGVQSSLSYSDAAMVLETLNYPAHYVASARGGIMLTIEPETPSGEI